MVQAIKKRVVVKPGGIVEVQDPDLPEGATAEVIVLLGEHAEAERASLAEMVGAARGVFDSVDEVDGYLRKLREEWD